MPIMGCGHGNAGVYAPHAGSYYVGSPVPLGNHTSHQQHVAAQPSSALLEYLGPQDYLGVPGLILDGDEHRAILC